MRKSPKRVSGLSTRPRVRAGAATAAPRLRGQLEDVLPPIPDNPKVLRCAYGEEILAEGTELDRATLQEEGRDALASVPPSAGEPAKAWIGAVTNLELRPEGHVGRDDRP